MQPALGASNETTQPDAASDWTIADGTTVGRFVVLAAIGRGSTGVVVAAFDRELARKVAIKFLSPTVTRQQDRLRTEAQALARLTHPNVIRIHDVGEHDGRVAMVMEYVEGDTLAGARISGTHGLDVWLAAGRGLAAAHRANLVHGDFKPANVLLGRDGRPRVGDFGHASLEAGNDRAAETAPLHDDDDRSADVATTTSGVLFGTPAYMAPEVFTGAAATARSDQFSYCVALYEALWSTRPFAGADVESLAVAVTTGALRSPPTFPVVPLRVRRAVLRGLSTDPASRFPSMDALLAELERDPWKWSRRIAPMVAAVALTWSFAAVGTEDAGARDYCTDVELRADALWSGTRAHAIEATFLATAAPFATDEFARASALVATSAESLREAERAACTAARDGSPGGEEVAARQLCLHLQHEQLAALLDLFERADAAVVEHAGDAARGLPTPDACTGSRGAPRIEDGQRDDLYALGADVARAWVAADAWRDAAALDTADAAAARATEQGAPWFAAQAHVIAGRVLERNGDATAAMPRFDAAFAAALASDQPEIAVSAALGLAGALSERGDHDNAVQWLGHAEASIGRTGARREALRRAWLHTRGGIAYHHGDFAAAKAAFTEILAAADDGRSEPGGGDRGTTLLNIGLSDANLGDNDAGIVSLRAALAAEIERHGDVHPALLRPLNAICHVEIDRGDTAAAIEACQRAIDVSRAGNRGADPRLSHLLTNLGSAYFHGGEPGQAEVAHLAALDNAMRTQPDDDLLIASIANNLGVLYDHLERVDEAAEHYEHAHARVTRAFGAAHPSTAMVGTNLAMVRVKQGDFDGAERLIRDGLTHMGARFGPDHPDLALGHAELGRLEAKRGDHAAAIAHFERAHALRTAHGGDDIELADTAWGLAISRAELHGRTAAVERLAAQARALYVAAGGDWAVRADELDAWLAGLQ